MNKAVSLQEHSSEYRLNQLPITTPFDPADVSYHHDSTICAPVGDDAMTGDQVACYAGRMNFPSQFALARNPNADATNNPPNPPTTKNGTINTVNNG